MIILDAHLPPALAVWISETFDIPCFSAQFLDLRHAEDEEIFTFSKTRNAIVITKDDDFVFTAQPFWQSAESNLADLWEYLQKQIERDFRGKRWLCLTRTI
jgi:hypothetical protein